MAKKKILRDMSTPESRKIWEAVDFAAERAPDWIKKKYKENNLMNASVKIQDHGRAVINYIDKDITQVVSLSSLVLACLKAGGYISDLPDNKEWDKEFSNYLNKIAKGTL